MQLTRVSLVDPGPVVRLVMELQAPKPGSYLLNTRESLKVTGLIAAASLVDWAAY